MVEKALSSARKEAEQNVTWRNIVSHSANQDVSLNVVLQHIIQHVWSIISCFRDTPSSMPLRPTNVRNDPLADEAILKHTGWCLKRVREIVNKDPDEIQVKQSPRESDGCNLRNPELRNLGIRSCRTMESRTSELRNYGTAA